jgi:hypothetical protein
MKKNFIFAAILACAIGGVPVHAELSLIQASGEGARATAMGNNFVALSGDVSAMFWNPAGFAFAPSRELQLSVEGLDQKTQTSFFGTNSDASLARPRLVDLGYMHAFPVVQGGFTLAASFHSPYLFDDVNAFSGSYTKAGSPRDTMSVYNQYKTFGALDMWSAGFGLQVAKGLGIGAAISLVTGQENASAGFESLTNGAIADPINDYYTETSGTSYVGYDFRVGILYSFLKRYRLGLRLVFPQTVWFTENVTDNSPDAPSASGSFQNTGKLFSSYSGAFGGAAVFPFLTVSAEVRARASYSFAYPQYAIPDNSLAGKTLYGAGVGFEAPLGVSWILGRAGFSWDQYDTHLFVKQYDNDTSGPGWDPQGLSPSGDKLQGSAGMGFVLHNVLLEWSYGYGVWKFVTNGVLNETHVQQRVLLSMAVHF